MLWCLVITRLKHGGGVWQNMLIQNTDVSSVHYSPHIYVIVTRLTLEKWPDRVWCSLVGGSSFIPRPDHNQNISNLSLGIIQWVLTKTINTLASLVQQKEKGLHYLQPSHLSQISWHHQPEDVDHTLHQGSWEHTLV